MKKIWQGRSSGQIDNAAEVLNASISFDKRMYDEDITASIAHVKMLCKCKIIPQEKGDFLISSLSNLKDDIDSGKVKIDETAEDIHSFVEGILISRIGESAKMIHTARSRNDQCVLDLRLWLDKKNSEIIRLTYKLVNAAIDKADEKIDLIMPGFTHLQHAQPVLFSHWLMAYAEMFYRDFLRFCDLRGRILQSPIGACALAGTTFQTDRVYEAQLLGMEGVIANSQDAVSDRDFALEFLFASSLLMMHLSRICEEIIIFSSTQYSFLKPSSDFSTGSSIMPQKKNPDMAELIRGKTGRVYGNLVSLLTTMKSLPLCYNKDMQEDKEAIFDTADTIINILNVFPNMLKTIIIYPQNMLDSAKKGYTNATDMADYLTKAGMTFRDAYLLVGQIVNYACDKNKKLEELSLSELKKFSSLFNEDVYKAIDIRTCVDRRISLGGTSTDNVKKEISDLRRKMIDSGKQLINQTDN